MIKILYIGRHEDILQTVVRLINKEDDWFGIGAYTNAEAMALFDVHNFDIVLLGCGIEPESESYLISYFNVNRPETKIVQHFGGGSGLLKNEILHALSGKLQQ
ncbi:hypothetical protein [Flavobacterium aquidurense]|uniref:hypothetical protein n=1 Tax=Flavobacterium aquidurense TaxID=362413 RepID=UPI0028593F9E|nr:hypothetical protein [Flavobacterium aquidurense]MDR7369927.1 hypothetical protein [Flavobacterium aquidurense]